MAKIFLQKRREKNLQRRHPWIFSGAIARVEGSPGVGATVDVMSNAGKWLARGAWSPVSQISTRVWTFEDEAIDRDFFRRRLRSAFALRAAQLEQPRAACRLVYGESDGLPGLIVDRYADVWVCQFLSTGAEANRDVLVAELASMDGCTTLYERSDSAVRKKEGLLQRTGLLAGPEPPPLVEIEEGDLRFLVDVIEGHKTGFYLDQRDSRGAVSRRCSGREVLDCFTYSGAFSVAAARAGATRVTQIDASAAALAMGQRHFEINKVDAQRVEQVEGNVFSILRQYRTEGRDFDAIILDPPKFADSRAKLKRACRGYKDINLLAFQLLRPGGTLFTFSCSGLLEADLFQKIVADAALDAGRFGRVVERLDQAADHPVALAFPEARYLKGLVCQVD